MRSAGTPVMGAAHSGPSGRTWAAKASNPTVWRATNSASWRPSPISTDIIASASAASVPGRIKIVSSDCAHASVSRTSIVITRAPRRRAATRCGAVFGWLARLAPQSRTRRACSAMSSFVFASRTPVSPRPKPPRPQQIIDGCHH